MRNEENNYTVSKERKFFVEGWEVVLRVNGV